MIVKRFTANPYFLIGIFCSLIILLTTGQQARSDAEQLILTGFEAPPYLFSDDSGNPAGLLVELVREASQKSGVPVEFAITNWPRAQLATQNGQADLIFPVVHTTEREEWLEYPSTAITRFEMTIFARKNPDFVFSGKTEDLHGLRIGKIAKGRMHPSFRKLEESGKATVEPRDNVEQLLTAVHHDRLDAFVAPKLMTLWTADKMGLDTIEPFRDPIGVSNIYLGFSRKSEKHTAWDKLRRALPTLELKKSLFLASLANR